jgi:hypothetical protein
MITTIATVDNPLRAFLAVVVGWVANIELLLRSQGPEAGGPMAVAVTRSETTRRPAANRSKSMTR